jgi:hypothetical protein
MGKGTPAIPSQKLLFIADITIHKCGDSGASMQPRGCPTNQISPSINVGIVVHQCSPGDAQPIRYPRTEKTDTHVTGQAHRQTLKTHLEDTQTGQAEVDTKEQTNTKTDI